jgi:hydrogenase maturation protease
MGGRAAQSVRVPLRRGSNFGMKTIVVGLGNPILGDDGIGWKVAEEVRKRLLLLDAELVTRPGGRKRGEPDYTDVEFLSLGGISLMERLIGYDRAVLIDAVNADQETGSILVTKLSELPDYSTLHMTSVHDTSLQNALRLGIAMGASLPEDVVVVGITTRHVYDFSEELTPPVTEAIPRAMKIVMDLLA